MLSSTRWKELIAKVSDTQPVPLFVRWQTSPSGPGIDYTLNSPAFELFAFDAGSLAFPSSPDPVRAWLEELRREGADPRIAGPEIQPDGSRKFYQLGSIRDAWQASIDLCQELALNAAISERHNPLAHSLTANVSEKHIKQKDANKRQGRPKGLTPVNGTLIKQARADLSQPAFARLCKISVDRLQRAENGGVATNETLARILAATKRLGRPVTL